MLGCVNLIFKQLNNSRKCSEVKAYLNHRLTNWNIVAASLEWVGFIKVVVGAQFVTIRLPYMVRFKSSSIFFCPLRAIWSGSISCEPSISNAPADAIGNGQLLSESLPLVRVDRFDCSKYIYIFFFAGCLAPVARMFIKGKQNYYSIKATRSIFPWKRNSTLPLFQMNLLMSFNNPYNKTAPPDQPCHVNR